MAISTGTTSEQPAAVRAGRLDLLRLVLGAVVLVMGVAVLVFPAATLLAVALLFGVQLLVSGLIRLVLASRSTSRGGLRIVSVVFAALTVLAGIVCVLQPRASLLVLVLSIALGWTSDGISDLTAGVTAGRRGPQRASLVVLGLASIAAAALMIVFPGTSLAVLTQLGGALLVVLGVFTLATAVRPRR